MKMKDILTNAIRIYQKARPAFYVFNFLGFSGGCRFSPSCSDYSIAVIEKKGILNGLARSFLRILKCGPWSRGGVDLP